MKRCKNASGLDHVMMQWEIGPDLCAQTDPETNVSREITDEEIRESDATARR